MNDFPDAKKVPTAFGLIFCLKYRSLNFIAEVNIQFRLYEQKDLITKFQIIRATMFILKAKGKISFKTK